jgi:hypothetical protein
MSSFFLNSGPAGFLPKHMIAGAIQRDALQAAKVEVEGGVERSREVERVWSRVDGKRWEQ